MARKERASSPRPSMGGPASKAVAPTARVARQAGALMGIGAPAPAIEWGFHPVPKPTKRTPAERITRSQERAQTTKTQTTRVRLQTHANYGPTWPQVSEAILRRDEGRCLVCGDPAVEVHHIVRVGQKGFDPELQRPDNLISVCRADHQAAERGRVTKAELRALLTAKYSYQYDDTQPAQGDAPSSTPAGRSGT